MATDDGQLTTGFWDGPGHEMGHHPHPWVMHPHPWDMGNGPVGHGLWTIRRAMGLLGLLVMLSDLDPKLEPDHGFWTGPLESNQMII